jgi:hypothetical protein
MDAREYGRMKVMNRERDLWGPKNVRRSSGISVLLYTNRGACGSVIG